MNEQVNTLQKEYPLLFEEAYQCMKNKRVKKYVFQPSGRVRWIVVGKTRDYIVLPTSGFCSCEDFFFRVMNHEKPMCYHLLAVKLALLTDEFDEIVESDAWHWRLMHEWVSGSKS